MCLEGGEVLKNSSLESEIWGSKCRECEGSNLYRDRRPQAGCVRASMNDSLEAEPKH